jgi:hypothetical protein
LSTFSAESFAPVHLHSMELSERGAFQHGEPALVRGGVKPNGPGYFKCHGSISLSPHE